MLGELWVWKLWVGVGRPGLLLPGYHYPRRKSGNFCKPQKVTSDTSLGTAALEIRLSSFVGGLPGWEKKIRKNSNVLYVSVVEGCGFVGW